ncbi:tail fiber domain-containing protein [Rhizobium phaseoli]|uniref:tail fiber domain-containing protein n=1 Tax=Rhizobium phaseoli TaxID=396 RepID=UPI0007E9C909|nr:tail fiber domain-containing protein [Rhizobium phaseoli]ANL41440.1 hypothetical protein AMC88_CH03075 [Rhizobium phaseoli]ANL60428.1 hypothetical protein AMC85_CH03074 [Rhizobium phaseoli]
MKHVITGIALLAMSATVSLAQDKTSADAQDISALIAKHQKLILPYVPVINLLDKSGNDLANADLSKAGLDADVLSDAERMVEIAKKIKPLLDKNNLDVADPKAAQDVKLAVSIGVALDMLRSDPTLKSEGSAAEADVLDDVAKAVIIGGMVFSDQRLKENIVYLGQSPSGLGIYEFSYLGTSTRWRGVLAQDVLGKKPDAVHRLSGGLMAVDYSKIDVGFTMVN